MTEGGSNRNHHYGRFFPQKAALLEGSSHAGRIRTRCTVCKHVVTTSHNASSQYPMLSHAGRYPVLSSRYIPLTPYINGPKDETNTYDLSPAFPFYSHNPLLFLYLSISAFSLPI